MSKMTENELGGFVYSSFINGETSAITKGQIVKLDSTVGQVKKTAATTDVAVGIVESQSAATSAQVSVLLFGPIKKSTVDTGETINYGDWVGPGGTVAGTIAKVTPGVGNKKVIGIAVPDTARTATETCPFIMLAQDINLATT